MVDSLQMPAISDHLHVFVHQIAWDQSAVAELAAKINASAATTVVLDSVWEASHAPWYQRYLRLIEAISCPTRRLFLVHNDCYAMQDQLRVPGITDVISVDFGLYRGMKLIRDHERFWNQQADQFLYLNGRDKPERFWLLHTMAENAWCMKQAQYSYYHKLPHDLIVDNAWLSPEHKKLTPKQYDDFCDRWGLNLDGRPQLKQGNLEFNASHLQHGFSVPQEWFRDTFFSLVVETTMLCNKPPWITEKTYYAIANHRPFIIAGDRHSLLRLKSHGYCTFEDILPYADYDSETDLMKKFEKIRANVEYLLHNKDRHADYLRQGTQHNSEVLWQSFRQTQQRLTEFIKKYALDQDIENLLPLKHHNYSEQAWAIFYANIKAPHWPECTLIHQFERLPGHIQDECLTHPWLLEFIKDTSKVNSQMPKKMLDAVQNSCYNHKHRELTF